MICAATYVQGFLIYIVRGSHTTVQRSSKDKHGFLNSLHKCIVIALTIAGCKPHATTAM